MSQYGKNYYFFALKGAVEAEDWRAAAEGLREWPDHQDLAHGALLELLFTAVRLNGGEALIPALIAKGADPSRRSIEGQTALEVACLAVNGTSQSLNSIEILLQNGADPNDPLSTGLRPLHLAASRGDVRLIRLLKRYGADPSLSSADPDPIDAFRAAKLSSRSDEVIAALDDPPPTC